MENLRKHWFDYGGIIAIIILIFLIFSHKNQSIYQQLMWFNFATLCFHQIEEYRFPGTFPGMINKKLFKSNSPDRYPLNTNTALFINVCIGWLFYFLAAYFSEKAIWLGLSVILISLGNFIAHTFLFNIEGKTLYNAGMLTSWILFLPCIYLFFSIAISENLITTRDYWIGIPLGVVLNIVGILKMIDWLKNKNTPFVFEQRNLLKEDRK